MGKKILFGIILIGVLALIGYFVILANFDLFDKPIETELKTECDYEGVRKIRMTEMSGNATSNKSIHIYVTDCNDDEYSYHEPIFTVSASFIKPNLVDFEWKNMDTVTIKYDKKLDVFEKIIVSETTKPKLTLEYIME
ncbi:MULTISPECIES: hypothetical protein [Winogradskyella]|uniref:hypothetical protein n=1 Tax=Winogradskyella TaxID=286104 RepID=UPI0015CAD06A|nr:MULTISPECIES: hypothetical protein [Winogradskyella]QXP78760.1 hypothetical protein H0I32_16385 [Winogradskyella sp. HaHa_3_26]